MEQSFIGKITEKVTHKNRNERCLICMKKRQANFIIRKHKCCNTFTCVDCFNIWYNKDKKRCYVCKTEFECGIPHDSSDNNETMGAVEFAISNISNFGNYIVTGLTQYQLDEMEVWRQVVLFITAVDDINFSSYQERLGRTEDIHLSFHQEIIGRI